MNNFDRHLIRFLIVSLCYFDLAISPAHAELIPTYSMTTMNRAAGGEFVGALVFVLVVLLVTDILGFTKIFSFTRSVKK